MSLLEYGMDVIGLIGRNDTTVLLLVSMLISIPISVRPMA
jgi:hypothetical protein